MPQSPVNPNPVPGSTAATPLGNLPVPPSSTSGGTTSLYGLGDWGAKQINAGNLPFPITGSGAATSGAATVTGDDIVKAFASGSPAQIAQIQQALLLGGFYPNTYAPDWGVARPQDLTAFGNAVQAAGQGGRAVSDYLIGAAQSGASLGAQAVKVNRITVPNIEDLSSVADGAFQTTLGRKATDEEKRAFSHAYQSMYVAATQAANAAVAAAGTGTSKPEHADPGGPTKEQQLTGEGAAKGIRDASGGRPLMTSPIQPSNAPGVNRALAEQGATVPPLPPEAPAAVPFGQQIAGLLPNPNDPNQTQNVVIQAPPDPSVAATDYARSHNPNEAGANDIANVFNNFLQILNGFSSGGG